ncbi:MAG TPA: MBL fold metallo-hydrolase [Vicinamibacteria bacterium]|jgi:glyoxylase-like metal-dependent hydrolase (beta-lactamase superfamily II)
MKRLATTLVACLGLAALAGSLDAGSAIGSYQEARKVLDAGIQAMGGLDALRDIKDVWREGAGTNYAQGQSLAPDGPLVARAVDTRSFQDFAGNQNASLVSTSGAGIVPSKVATVAKDNGFSYNMVTKVLTPMAPAALSSSRTNMRRDPSVLLLLANERAETLRSLGEDEIAGRRYKLVTFSTAEGAQIGLAFDATTGLLSRVQTLADNAILGDALTETVLDDYREVPVGSRKAKLAYQMTTIVAGETTQDLKYVKVTANGGVPSGLLDQPTGAETVPAAAPGSGVTLTKVGEDVYFAGGGSHHSLFVVFKDHVVVVEAPLGEERSLAVLAKVAETAPGKPVRYVVPTHYHSDHTGGLRTYIAKGVTVLTTAGNRGFVERLAKAPRTIRPDLLAREPKAAAIETFTGKKVLSDGVNTLELVDIGPNPHVTEAVVAYLPKQKAVFEADLLTIPVQGPYPPASPGLVDFADKLVKRGLVVETILPGHGRIGNKADLTAALAVKAAAN